jgi:hypothetical protein
MRLDTSNVSSISELLKNRNLHNKAAANNFYQVNFWPIKRKEKRKDNDTEEKL